MEEGSPFREFLRETGRVPAATVISFRAREMYRLRFHVASRDCKQWLASHALDSRPSHLKHFI